MLEEFEIAGGSVAGRDHRHALTNCQDAYAIATSKNVVAGVVADGCTSGEHSEVGAKIGARIAVDQLLRVFQAEPTLLSADPAVLTGALARVRRGILTRIASIADAMGGSYSKTVSDYFLFTLVGVVATEWRTVTFVAGDGVIAPNERVVEILSENNKPSYIAYDLVDSTVEAPPLAVVNSFALGDVRQILIGTDGLGALVKASDRKVPGKDEPIGFISQFWENDAHFKNPFSIQRRLRVINRDYMRIDYDRRAVHEEHGPLADDATLVVFRRRRMG